MAVIDEQRLRQIYCGEEFRQLEQIGHYLTDRVVEIVRIFYNELMERDEARFFLDSRIVAQRLTGSMTEWLQELFRPHDEPDLVRFLDRQRQIGETHARINIPMHLVVEGGRIIRREIGEVLAQVRVERGELVHMVVLVNEVLDHAMSLINESYVNNAVNTERNVQSLRLQMQPHLLALECERMKVNLRDWLLRLWKLRSGEIGQGELPPMRRSEFGLWVNHKAPLVFANTEMVRKIQRRAVVMEEICQGVALGPELVQGLSREQLRLLEEEISQIGLLLDLLVEEVLEMDSGRDPLTRVFNRRFLETVVRHEMGISLRHDMPFGLLLCDIDHFKKINDTYGHDAGDMVLRQFAAILLANVRGTDYIFRFGGEEFLVLLGDMSASRLGLLAEKFRSAVESNVFHLTEARRIKVTASFGGAMHDGHPDYLRTLKRADEALYTAKHGGRNRVELASIADR
ncbi:MAG: GGDEF domain-containing protein [Magnetococcales bacterium]|nr:GGDEF domain-containing protein [Magnetococcales bacterium]